LLRTPSSVRPLILPYLSIIGIAKNKIKNFIQSQDLTLSSLFKLIDTNSDASLSLSEFLSKMRAMQMQLDDDEIKVLFKALDKTGMGTITYK